jgi:hypothetical protein
VKHFCVYLKKYHKAITSNFYYQTLRRQTHYGKYGKSTEKSTEKVRKKYGKSTESTEKVRKKYRNYGKSTEKVQKVRKSTENFFRSDFAFDPTFAQPMLRFDFLN